MDTWRRKTAEYEADLYGVQEPSFISKLLGLRMKHGEVEIKEYSNGEKEMEFELHGLSIPDGAVVSVVVNAATTCELKTNRGHSRLLLSTARGETIPEVNIGSVVEIRYMGETLLKGTFKPD